MKRNYIFLLSIWLFVLFWALLMQTSWTIADTRLSKNNHQNSKQISNTDQAAPTPTPKASWLILPDMPESASDADIGEEIYILVCRDCHGDKGQGLTVEWRATWAPQDQNCWQSKCHNSTHPIEGFILPRYIPAVMGDSSLVRFETVLDLYDFVSTRMPWHKPGSLTEEEYWQLTLFLLRENNLYSDSAPLERHEAAALRLWSKPSMTPTPIPAAASPPPSNNKLWWSIMVLSAVPLLIGVISGIKYWTRSSD